MTGKDAVIPPVMNGQLTNNINVLILFWAAEKVLAMPYTLCYKAPLRGVAQSG